MRNKCLFALGLVFAMSLTSIVAFAFSFTGEPDVKNDQQQIVVVNPATESEETTSDSFGRNRGHNSNPTVGWQFIEWKHGLGCGRCLYACQDCNGRSGI